MKAFIATAAVATLAFSSAAFAQSTPAAQTPPAGQDAPKMLGNTGLTQDQGAALVAGAVMLGVALSDDDSTTTTTTGN
ncbi:hypothetical protein [Pseudodonghicola flavimaris]|uniref:Uncharacterized protein n=1 Tax=Pseudodonghicola flavimaris TaxID=3050036 RepID=A0ABT7F156_9RHOB|nr:hypothetical protein [Pseudodonghicola flavimaris]MDK3018339.1 hypothetical protein [Pseudodonghicola flavimaris]